VLQEAQARRLTFDPLTNANAPPGSISPRRLTRHPIWTMARARPRATLAGATKERMP
jgi:hypothetical protein